MKPLEATTPPHPQLNDNYKSTFKKIDCFLDIFKIPIKLEIIIAWCKLDMWPKFNISVCKNFINFYAKFLKKNNKTVENFKYFCAKSLENISVIHMF